MAIPRFDQRLGTVSCKTGANAVEKSRAMDQLSTFSILRRNKQTIAALSATNVVS